MKVAHIILAHKQPEQLARLAKRLSHPDADIFVHIDARKDIQSFRALRQQSNVIFVTNRKVVYPNSYSLVQATISSFEQIVSSGIQYNYVNLLSGQDYPLTDASFFHQYLAIHRGKLFMEYYSVKDIWCEALPRITKYYLADFNIPGKYRLERLINAVAPARKMPYNLTAFGRSGWFTIPLDAVKYILEYLQAYPKLAKFFRLSWAPAEMIFQTILFNSHYKKLMVNNSLRYTDWSEGKPSPKIFTMGDLEAIWRSGCLFAHKLDMTVDNAVFDAIDEAVYSVSSATAMV